ncbi:pirin family protein [Pedosphaera parvula]|uniref:Pirin domain protein n=1 Tax=Pedosphaera parvula (strain Ellin514) TaxID=320771 RepID=B9XM78_PEDPL|nr:pirin family protein [Pedosphaera parvula]EEF59071.1 Pirin domain protein [Pedosphaera parvula Ellin514]
MITIRKSDERGHANHGWLDSYHSFSFADYYDPKFMGYRSLRVINDDKVSGGAGFGMHPHRDMEIVTYLLSGALEHRDSMGNGAVMKPGDVQRMTAGTGVLHSEKNYSPIEPVHLLQIWILPEQQSLKPGYEQKSFTSELTPGKLVPVVSKEPKNGALKIHQDMDLLIGKFNPGDKASYELKPNRHAWVQVAEGKVTLNGQELKAGDGAAVNDERNLSFEGKEPAQVLLFDLN